MRRVSEAEGMTAQELGAQIKHNARKDVLDDAIINSFLKRLDPNTCVRREVAELVANDAVTAMIKEEKARKMRSSSARNSNLKIKLHDLWCELKEARAHSDSLSLFNLVLQTIALNRIDCDTCLRTTKPGDCPQYDYDVSVDSLTR